MKRRNKESKSSTSLTIKTRKFIALLKSVYFKDMIDDIQLVIDDKYGCIEAVDMSNSIMVIAKSKILKSEANIKLGLSNIDILIKFVNALSDAQIDVKIENNKLHIQRKDSKRSLFFLLTDPELIPTIIQKENEEQDIKEKLLDIQEYKSILTNSFIKDYLSYIGMSKSKQTTVIYNGKEIVFVCGNENEHQFKLVLDNDVETLDKKKENIEVVFNGEFLAKIFNVLEFDSDNPPKIYIGHEKPLLIESENTLWALNPNESEESTNEQQS